MLQLQPDDEAYERVKKDLEKGEQLNCRMVTDVFGWPVVELFLMCGHYDEIQFNKLLDELKLNRTISDYRAMKSEVTK